MSAEESVLAKGMNFSHFPIEDYQAPNLELCQNATSLILRELKLEKTVPVVLFIEVVGFEINSFDKLKAPNPQTRVQDPGRIMSLTSYTWIAINAL
jgi:hypothetical protein